MRLHKLTQALMLVLAPLCVQAADTAKPVVNLYIWGEYLAPDTLTNFEKKPVSMSSPITSTPWKPSRPNCSPVAADMTWC